MSAERDSLEPRESEAAAPAPRPRDRAIEIERPIGDGDSSRLRSTNRPPRADDTPTEHRATALFEPTTLRQFNDRWSEIQTGFVDEPRRAVQEADALVSDVIKRIAGSFGSQRAELERQWARGDDVSTEDLRLALQRYRSFFSRLLSV
jgi:hypothetical protein